MVKDLENIDLYFTKLDLKTSNYLLRKVTEHINGNSRIIFDKYLASDYGYVWGEGDSPAFPEYKTIYEMETGNSMYSYYQFQKGRKEMIEIDRSIIRRLERSLKIDLSWVNSIYINIYKEGNGAFPHIDHSERYANRNFSILSLTLGWGSTFTLSEDYNFVERIFDSEEYENSSLKKYFLGHGDIMIFGGDYRLSAHRTGNLLRNTSEEDFSPLKVRDFNGKLLDILAKYRINLTFRKC